MRHKFTPDECRRGYWAALESIARRHFALLEADGYRLARRFLFARVKGGGR